MKRRASNPQRETWSECGASSKRAVLVSELDLLLPRLDQVLAQISLEIPPGEQIATDIQKEISNQPRDANFLLKETQRKLTDANSQLEKRVIDVIDFFMNKSSRIINEKFDAIQEENKKTLDELKEVLEPRRQYD